MTTNEPQCDGLDAIETLIGSHRLLTDKFGGTAREIEHRHWIRQEAQQSVIQIGAALSAMAALKAERDQLRATLAGIIEIGKRDMSNPKYDGYFASARAALNAAKVGGVR